MHLVLTSLTSAVDVSASDAARLTQIVLAHMGNDDRLEHVRVRATPGRCDIGAFVIAPDRRSARRIVYDICARVLELEPELAGYRVEWFAAGE